MQLKVNKYSNLIIMCKCATTVTTDSVLTDCGLTVSLEYLKHTFCTMMTGGGIFPQGGK